MARLDEWLDVAKTVAGVMYESDVKYPASALAYYAFVSFVPLLVLVFAVGGRQLAAEVTARTPRFVTPAARQLVYEALTTATGRTGAAVLSIATIAWGGANVAVGFLRVVERVEGANERPLSVQVRNAAVVLGTLALAMLAILLLTLLLAVSPVGFLGTVVGFFALFVVLTATFLPLYYVPSRLVAAPAAALPGALTTACGWTVLHAGIQFYTANAGQYAIYGVLSGLIIILTTTYLAALVLMAGAVVNATLATDTDGEHAASAEPD